MVEKAKKEFEEACLGSFSFTRRGEAIQKTTLPKPRNITITEDSVRCQEMFDQSMHHEMINQSGVLMNSVQNTIKGLLASGIQMGYKGPYYS